MYDLKKSQNSLPEEKSKNSKPDPRKIKKPQPDPRGEKLTRPIPNCHTTTDLSTYIGPDDLYTIQNKYPKLQPCPI